MAHSTDPAPRTGSTDRALGRGMAALRILFGLIYLSNAFAKLIDVADYRIGPIGFNLIARDATRAILENAAQDTWIAPLGAFYQAVVLPNFGFFEPFLIVAEFAIGLGLLFGVASRAAALGGLALIGPIWLMLLDDGLYLWAYPVELAPLVILALVPAGRVWGLDGRPAGRFGGRWPF
ncbi:hypothetical protein [Pseudonocardia sp.]|uniref:hypothetical protein n=1 Tax=Pseudonocardia sp. TaxID=60912 RepID=UPI00263801AD|nr:hypothetical protein [Pseudonocardia sp.]